MVTNDRAKVVTAWCGHMRRRGLKPGTIDCRRRLLSRWWDRCGDVWTASHELLEEWIDELDMSAASSRYGLVSNLHAFYRWAIRAGLTEVDPTERVERPKLTQRLPRPTHPTDLALALFTATPELRVGLLLAATSGLRCCEIARLQWDDVHDGEARVMGKGGRERVVPLHAETVEALEAIDRVSVWVLDGWQTTAAAHPGLRASQRLNRHLRSLGIASTAHALRHFAGTAVLRASKGDLRLTQEFLGHASPATTAIYTALDRSDMAAVVARIEVPSAAA